MLATRHHLWTWLVLVSSSLVLAAFDLSTEKVPRGPLGIRLDRALALSTGSKQPVPQSPSDSRSIVLSSHLVFNSEVSLISDGQLRQIVTDAYKEMEPALTQYGFRSRAQPAVMTILAVGREIFLASSQRGAVSFTYDKPASPVALSLERCQMLWPDTHGPPKVIEGEVYDQKHQNTAKCGELMTAHMYYRLNTGVENMSGLGARALTVWRRAKGEVLPKAPCGSEQDDEVSIS